MQVEAPVVEVIRTVVSISVNPGIVCRGEASSIKEDDFHLSASTWKFPIHARC